MARDVALLTASVGISDVRRCVTNSSYVDACTLSPSLFVSLSLCGFVSFSLTHSLSLTHTQNAPGAGSRTSASTGGGREGGGEGAT